MRRSGSRRDRDRRRLRRPSVIPKKGKAEVGDKTVLDALVPSVTALASSSDEGLSAMIAAARKGTADTTASVSRRGRAAWLGERTIGHPTPVRWPTSDSWRRSGRLGLSLE
ncbi:MAG: DAK2 domain-containing protein [Chloroflexota bacterium]|nr:DAK2 domain-containing protein [Chloroflexota bacterium]